MHIIEAVPLLLGILSGFVTGIMAGIGIAVIRSARTDFALATLDRMMVVLSLVAAFGLGVFVSLALR